MMIQYGPYDTSKNSVIELPNGESELKFPTNMDPSKILKMECSRDESNKVVVSLMDDNSIMYTRDQWQELLKTPPLQREYESKMDEVVGKAEDFYLAFLDQE